MKFIQQNIFKRWPTIGVVLAVLSFSVQSSSSVGRINFSGAIVTTPCPVEVASTKAVELIKVNEDVSGYCLPTKEIQSSPVYQISKKTELLGYILTFTYY